MTAQYRLILSKGSVGFVGFVIRLDAECAVQPVAEVEVGDDRRCIENFVLAQTRVPEFPDIRFLYQ